MERHWQELLSDLQYKSGESIIDVGGAMDPVPVADVVVDIINPLKRFSGTFLHLDLASQVLPYPDKYFDICICSQTLEDLTSPVIALKEMQRVAKRGIIEVPHRGVESLKNTHYNGYTKPDYSMPEVWHFGVGHHKWLIDVRDGALFFVPKIQYMLMRHPIPQWNGTSNIRFQWDDTINFNVLYDIHEHVIDSDYAKFRSDNERYWK